MPRKIATPQEKADYARGWRSSSTGVGGNDGGPTKLERADMRGERAAWYDGWEDFACDRPRGHSLRCADRNGHEGCWGIVAPEGSTRPSEWRVVDKITD